MSDQNKQLQRTNQPQGGKPKALEIMASRLHVDPMKMLSTLKETVFKGCTDEELLALVVISNQYDLSPILREIYAFKSKGGGIVPIVSIDGWNKMLLRQETFDGIEFEFTEDQDDGKPITCTATIYVKNRSRPVKITEYFTECYRNTDPWNNMPHRMLRNRTLCQAARVAFGFAGIIDPDEAIDIVATTVSDIPAKPLKAIKPASEGGGNSPPASEASETANPGARSPQDELETRICEAGFSFDEFRRIASEIGLLEKADTIDSFEQVPAKDATRLLRAVTGLLAKLAAAKEGKAA